MIYLLVYIYLFLLIIFYDFRKTKRYGQENKVLAILVLIFLAGLRYRLGSDTIAYMDDFEYYPKLSELTLKDFEVIRYQPLWIILNSLCRSLGSFTYVQIITSAIHIGAVGYVTNKICPSLFFSSLLYYYLFDFFNFNMDVMREALAIAFFMLALLALEKRKYKIVVLYAVVATLFHIFALPVFIIFILYYKFLLNKPYLGIATIGIFAVLGWISKDFMSNLLLAVLVEGSGTMSDRALTYASSEFYGVNDASIVNTISFLLKGSFYIWGLYKLKPIYQKYVNFDWKIFSTTCWLSSILVFSFYSMPILHRPYQYFSIFQSLLFILLFIYIAQKFKKPYWASVYIVMICLVTVLGIRKYMKTDRVSGEYVYYKFYPYSSVFDKTLNRQREKLYDQYVL